MKTELHINTELHVGDGWRTRAQPAALYLGAALVFVVLYFGLAHARRAEVRSFWDARVYATAIQEYVAGSDPYAASRDGMDFVYPPLFLHAGALLTRAISSGLAWAFYVGLLSLAMCAIPWALMAVFGRSEWLTPLMVCVLFVFQPKLFAEGALMTGNVATLFYAAILVAAMPGLRQNRWTLFYVAVVLASLVKLPFITLLAFSSLAGSNQFRKSAAAALIVVSGYAADWIADRRLFVEFLANVKRQVLDGGDTGLGVLAMFLKMGNRVAAMRGLGSVIACAAVIGGMLGFLCVLKRYRGLPGIAEIWVPTALVAAILSNPRMMSYDADIAVVPGIFLFVQWARPLKAPPYRGVWIATPPAIFLVVFSIGPATAIFLLIFGSMLLVLFQIALAARRAPGGAVLAAQGAF